MCLVGGWGDNGNGEQGLKGAEEERNRWIERHLVATSDPMKMVHREGGSVGARLSESSVPQSAL